MLMWPASRALLIAFSRYISVVLALYVAFALDLPNPWWAMVTVYIAQPPLPLVGAIWAKAFYRAAGTIIGAVASIVLIPNLANSPELMVLALAGWIGLCVFGGLLDRTPRSYLLLLAGYTVALIGLPAATHPGDIFGVAVARAEEIIIGVLAPALVQSCLFPRSVATAMTDKLNGIMRDARAWLSESLRSLAPAPAPRHLAIQLTEVNLMATDWRFEGTFSGFRRRALRALEERLIALLPLTAAVEDQLVAVNHAGVAKPELSSLTSRIAAWVATAESAATQPDDLVSDGIRAVTPALGPSSTWADMLVAGLAVRLTELVLIWQECTLLADAIGAPIARTSKPVRDLIGRARPRALHVDRGIAILSGAVAGSTVIGVAVFSIAIRWESAPFAVATAAACCSLFSAVDDPVSLVRDFFIGILVALPLTLLYDLAILPSIDGFVMLSAVLFPAVAGLGLFLTYPRLTIMALGASIAFSAGLALQITFVSDLPSLLNVYLALALGPIFAAIGLGVARVLPPHRVIRRIVRAAWRDLATLTRAQPVPDQAIWLSRMLDRVGLLLPRISRVEPSEESHLAKALRDLRLGVGIIELRRLRARFSTDTRREFDAVLGELAEHFDELSRGKPVAVPTNVVGHLDAMMSGIMQLTDPADRHAGISAAMDFRRTLLPQAPTFQAHGAAR